MREEEESVYYAYPCDTISKCIFDKQSYFSQSVMARSLRQVQGEGCRGGGLLSTCGCILEFSIFY